MPTAVHRLSAPVVARFVGVGLVLWAVLLFAGSLGAALGALPLDLLVVLAVLGLLAAFGGGWWLRNRAWILRCSDEGYEVRLVRGAGVTSATWREVRDVATTHRHQVPCLVLRLDQERTTTIPVAVLDADREELVRDLQARLQRAHGLRPLDG